ncbi:MAG: hypothetical protein M3295_10005 [Chloroflexota bacterium]|nr:hypothetical protein [Chloroflexota bacterium]
MATVLSAGALIALAATPAAAAHGGDPQVIVMQHVCNADIQTVDDFVAVENQGAGGQPGGEGTLPGLVATVLACPAIVTSADMPTDGIHADPGDFEYTVTDGGGAAYQLSTDGEFMAGKLCESDVDLDVDGDGDKDDTTCLDVSMYGFSPIAEGDVVLTQTVPPGDSRFGTIRFTPGSGDDATLAAATNGAITLDTSADATNDENPLRLPEYNDDVVTVHVYNFVNVAAPAPTTTPGAMPNTAVAAPGGGGLPILLGILAVSGAAGTAVALRRVTG